MAEGRGLGAAAAPLEKWECQGGKGAAFQVGLAVICALCSVHVFHSSLNVPCGILRLPFGFYVSEKWRSLSLVPAQKLSSHANTILCMWVW